MKKKQSMTLLEIMIVIFLIGLISSVLGYNMKGSLDKGRAFRTTEGIRMVRDILLLEVAEGASIEEVVDKPEHYLTVSGLVPNPDKSLKDGWGKALEISAKGDDIVIFSKGLENYNRKHGKATDTPNEQEN